MATRVSKRKHFELYRQSMDLRLALGLLSVFTLLVSIYLIASCGRLVSSLAVLIESPAASVARGVDEEVPVTGLGIIPFNSQDDIKSYVDDGKRLYGDGIFEAESLSPLAQAGKEVLSAPAAATKVVKNTAPVLPAAALDPSIMQKYFSLSGRLDATKPDVIQVGKTNIYYSPENQYYAGASENIGNQDEFPGETRVLSAFPVEALTQTESIPADGNILLAQDSLMVFLGNSLVAYNSDPVFGRQELWRDRVSDGSELVGSRLVEGKLYLAISTRMDEANPCPVKPINAGGEPLLVKCGDIYHPQAPMLADSVITVAQISPATGKIENSLSYLARAENGTVVFAEDGIYSIWGEGGDYISFVSDFLNEKCKSLLPNFILEKAARLGGYNISLLAKEMELRSMLMNWLSTLSADEQTRISEEISTRLADYLSGNYRAFEKTRIVKIDRVSFKFVESAEITGLITDGSFVNAEGGYLRLLTVSGRGALEKMNWLFTGQTKLGAVDEAVNNVYVMDQELKTVGSAQDLNIPGAVCALRYSSDMAYASACLGDKLYLINLSLAENIGLASELNVGSNDFYVYPLKDRELLVISKNKRNIAVAIYDNVLASKPELRSEYELNDYWADFDSNYRAFTADDRNGLFFVPAGKGGYVFFHNNGKIELQKNIGTLVPSRAYLTDGLVYILSESGFEAFGAPEWTQAGKFIFE